MSDSSCALKGQPPFKAAWSGLSWEQRNPEKPCSVHIFHILCHASCHRCNMMMYCNMMQLGCVIVIHRCDKVQCWCQNNPMRHFISVCFASRIPFCQWGCGCHSEQKAPMHQQIYMDLPHVAMCKASRPGKKGLPPNMLIVSQGYQSLGQFSVVNTMVSLVFEETEGEIQNRKLKNVKLSAVIVVPRICLSLSCCVCSEDIQCNVETCWNTYWMRLPKSHGHVSTLVLTREDII